MISVPCLALDPSRAWRICLPCAHRARARGRTTASPPHPCRTELRNMASPACVGARPTSAYATPSGSDRPRSLSDDYVASPAQPSGTINCVCWVYIIAWANCAAKMDRRKSQSGAPDGAFRSRSAMTSPAPRKLCRTAHST